jgi:hypothetical protein
LKAKRLVSTLENLNPDILVSPVSVVNVHAGTKVLKFLFAKWVSTCNRYFVAVYVVYALYSIVLVWLMVGRCKLNSVDP